jgi:prepilin-type processing-associated H-X9-DG protein
LIELLVVIAIISLLVSILLPSLTQARELARTAVCSANVRQQSMAVQMYLQDNNETFFVPQWQNGSTLWPDYIGKYLGYEDSAVIWSGGNLYGGPTSARWYKGLDIWRCPTRMSLPPFTDPYGGQYWACYGATHRSDGSAEWYTLSLVERSPDSVIVLADGNNSSLNWMGSAYIANWMYGRFAPRHGAGGGRTNVAMLDSHVETVDWDETRLLLNLIPWSVGGQ